MKLYITKMSADISLFRNRYKLVLLGEQCVGKTSIINQFAYGSHDVAYQATVGIDFLSKNFRVKEDLYRLQLWDTAGQERFRSLVPTYIRGSSAAVVVYDVTNPQSFDRIEKWIFDVREERGDDIIILMVGNKIDLEKERKVTKKQGLKKSRKLKVYFHESSAKLPHTVQELFHKLALVLPEEIAKNQDQNVVDVAHKNKEDIAIANKFLCSC